MLICLDNRVQRGRIHQPFFDQQAFERFHPQGGI